MYRFLILRSVVESSALSKEYGAMAKSLPQRYTLCSPLQPVFWVLCVRRWLNADAREHGDGVMLLLQSQVLA